LEERVALIKRVKLAQEFEEALEVHALLKVGPIGPKVKMLHSIL